MITGSVITLVLISWRLHLGSNVGLLLLLPFHDVLKKLHTFLHAIALFHSIRDIRLTSLGQRSIWLVAERGMHIHRLVIQILLVGQNIYLLLFLVESLLICAPFVKELFLLGVGFHLRSLFNLPFA